MVEYENRLRLQDGTRPFVYDVEERRQLLWRNLVNNYAPSLVNFDPPLTVVLSALPHAELGNPGFIRKNVAQSIATDPAYQPYLATDTLRDGTVTLQISSLTDRQTDQKAQMQKYFLYQVASPAVRDTTMLGVNYRGCALEKGGVIFLPYEKRESKGWAVFHELGTVLGKEGLPLIAEFFPQTLRSLAKDLTDNRDNTTVQEIMSFMDAVGFSDILRTTYDIPHKSAIDHAMQALLTYATKGVSQNIIGEAVKLLRKVDRNDLAQKLGVRPRKKAYDEKLLGRAARLLGCTPEDVISHQESSEGLVLTAKSLRRMFPSDLDSALFAYAALLYMSNISQHPHSEADRTMQDFRHLLSRKTLGQLLEEFKQIFPDGITKNLLDSKPDPIINHENTHGLMTIIWEQEAPGKGKNNILPNEENIVEAVNINSGFRSTVEACYYYMRSHDDALDIEMKARELTSLTPERREEVIRRYARTNVFRL